MFPWNRNFEAQLTNTNPKYEEAEENGVREMTTGDRYMKRRQTEKRYSAATSTAGTKERRKEWTMNICQQETVYKLVHTIKTERCSNISISYTRKCTDFYTVLNEGESDCTDGRSWRKR